MESDPVFFDRFNREQDIGKALDHPAVMKVFPDDDRSQIYMVMEWVDGKLLRKILDARERNFPANAPSRSRSASAMRLATSTPTASCIAT